MPTNAEIGSITRFASVSSALTTVQNGATGDGSTPEQCPGIDDLTTSLTALGTAQTNLGLVLQATGNCSFIDYSSGDLNTVEQKLSTFVEQGDLGCSSSPSCGDSLACQALSLGCVQGEVNDDSSLAGDGVVSSCEIVQNCLGSNCF